MAGFDVTGVDIAPQPNYPGNSSQPMPWISIFTGAGIWYWASPPCQAYSDLANRNGNGHEWPKLIEPMREKLKAARVPYVIENVEGAPLVNPVRLCGTQFKSLRVLRHRLFEASFPITDLPHGKHPKVHAFDKRKAHFGKTCEWKDFVQVTGGGNSSVASAANAMGIWWMTKDELNEAIPPAYAYHVARCFLKLDRTQPGVSDVPVSRKLPTTAPDSSEECPTCGDWDYKHGCPTCSEHPKES